MDSKSNQTYSGTVGVKNNTDLEKNLYFNLFGQKQIILFTT